MNKNEENLFETLRILRNAVTSSECYRTLSYYTNDTLQAFAVQRPITKQAMLKIDPCGEKYDRFGYWFLAMIRNCQKQDPYDAALASLEDLIAKGESEKLEFKATLRWDEEKDCLNTELEDVVVKEVAAFANAQGGSIFIGVRDDGGISGLDADYQSSDKISDKDGFERHLRSLLNSKFGEAFVTNKVHVKFHKHPDGEICRVDIEPGGVPLFVKITNKLGQPLEAFYLRNGNMVNSLSGREQYVYIRERFNH